MEDPTKATKDLLKQWIKDDEKDLETVKRIRDEAATDRLRDAMKKQVKDVEDAIKSNQKKLDDMK